MALKLKMLLRGYTWLWRLIVENVPTAYIVEPHLAIWRICSTVVVVAGKCGIEVTGVVSTGPVGVAAWAAGNDPATPKAEATARPPAAASFTDLKCNAAPQQLVDVLQWLTSHAAPRLTSREC